MNNKLTVKFEEVGIKDINIAGGKNASLGEMIRTLGSKGVKVPSGFVITADAYRYFLKSSGLDVFIKKTLNGLDTRNLKDLAKRAKIVRDKINATPFPRDLVKEIESQYYDMEKRYGKNIDVAVRSSATAEDLPGASFAGEQETYLAIRGTKELVVAARAAMASLFTDRAISYRVDKHFDHLEVALSVGVQKMVRSDKGVSGVMFTVDTESGFKDLVIINGSYGLGEMIVQGEVTPDEFLIYKSNLEKKDKDPIIEKHMGVKLKKMIYAPSVKKLIQTKIISTTKVEQDNFILTDKEIITLATWGAIIEKHYTDKNGHWTPMDIEWAKDGMLGELFIVQARPETVQAEKDFSKVKEYRLSKSGMKSILEGISVGSHIASGPVHIILNTKNIGDFKKGEILVTTMTDPDWEPIMKMASAIITDKGGRTSHAAIVSRELGIPAVVGTETATKKLKNGQAITVDTTGSDGIIYDGKIPFTVIERDLKKMPVTKTKIMVNVAMPDTAFENSFYPSSGVGLAREEFIIASKIGIHPLAMINFDKLPPKFKVHINNMTHNAPDKVRYYVDNLAYGIAKIAAAFNPRPVIVRFSDFKTNEYRALVGGELYEPYEENPMIGWRGASRYYDPKFKPAFKLECLAMKKVREEMGFENVIPMVPFCRTADEGKNTLEIMEEAGLHTNYSVKNLIKNKKDSQGKTDIKITPIYVMCEIPSNVILADDFLDVFDGMSIGSNDLTQLTLGLDRDSGIVSKVANENNPAVKDLISQIIPKCISRKKYIGICGQAPSDYPEFADFLVEKGIESMSLNSDTVASTIIRVYEKENKLKDNK
jgi:pyruvate,water dikinase